VPTFKNNTKVMIWWKKVIIFVLSLLALIFILNIGIIFWIKKELPKIINEKNDSPYHVVYQTIDIKLLSGTILINDITLAPKQAAQDTSVKDGLYASISEVDINGLSIWSFIFKKRIEASKITISKPEIILYKDDDKALNNPKSINESVVEPFKNTIAVSDIFLLNASVKIISTTSNSILLDVNNLSFNLDDVVLNDETLNEKIPFHYKNFDFACDSIYFRANEFYHIKADKILSSKSDLRINNLEVIPEYNRVEFVAKIPMEEDLYTVHVQSLSLLNMDWGFENEDFYFYVNNIVLDTLVANVFRSKIPEDDLSKKPLFNALLREIPFKMQVDTLLMRDATLEYEEEKSVIEGPGLVSFHEFNLIATNISSGFKSVAESEVKIDVDCLFMNVAPLIADWRFNVRDTTDAFTIIGRVLEFPANQIHPFTKPYLNVAIDGQVDGAYFNFTGNDVRSSGNFAIKYHDLKVTVYKNNSPREKNKLLTVVGNVLVKKDSKLKVKEVEVEVERIQEKSFFNFLFRNVAEGLKKTLL
jgi:hypothetical protein